jgi:hypothetical protein
MAALYKIDWQNTTQHIQFVGAGEWSSHSTIYHTDVFHGFIWTIPFPVLANSFFIIILSTHIILGNLWTW